MHSSAECASCAMPTDSALQTASRSSVQFFFEIHGRYPRIERTDGRTDRLTRIHGTRPVPTGRLRPHSTTPTPTSSPTSLRGRCRCRGMRTLAYDTERRSLIIHFVSKKDTDVARYNFSLHQPIMTIFGRDVAERVHYRTMV